MELGKIGDQNVEFFKGHPMLFCATKSVLPFKRYGHIKMKKGEKKSKYEKKCFFPHSFVFNTFFFILSTLSGSDGCVELTWQLDQVYLSKK